MIGEEIYKVLNVDKGPRWFTVGREIMKSKNKELYRKSNGGVGKEDLAFMMQKISLRNMLSNLDPEKEEAYKRPTGGCACILGEGIRIRVLQVGSQIEDIKAKIAYLKQIFQDYGIIESTMQAGEPSSLNETQRESKDKHFLIFKHDVIGFDEDLNSLVEFLLREEKGNRVASICVKGGLGK